MVITPACPASNNSRSDFTFGKAARIVLNVASASLSGISFCRTITCHSPVRAWTMPAPLAFGLLSFMSEMMFARSMN